MQIDSPFVSHAQEPSIPERRYKLLYQKTITADTPDCIRKC